jgi:archaellum component FlaF (FlaF/FlaG flagellin family)
LEVTSLNAGIDLNISVNLGNLVYLNLTNDGSTDAKTDFIWLFTDGGTPTNFSDGHEGYISDTIFPGETFEFYYDSGAQATASRVAVTIDGVTKAKRIA